jgi:hypothetical protein
MAIVVPLPSVEVPMEVCATEIVVIADAIIDSLVPNLLETTADTVVNF